MTSEHGNILERGSRLKKLLAASATALVLGAAAASPSWAAIDPEHSVTVFTNRDMVVAENYDPNTPIRVEVLRNGVLIGQTDPDGRTADAGGVGVLEVNHGPAGVPQPGDCWVGTTPDIRGNDVVRVTTPDGVETMTVADVAITSGPTEDPDNGSVVVEGRAVAEGGGRIPLAELAEDVRDLTPRWRGDPDSLGYVGATTTWRAVYEAPFADNVDDEENGTTEEARRDSILTGGHSITRTNGLGNEITSAEQGEPGGPGPGCDAPAAKNNLTSVSPDVLNAADVAANSDVTVGGVIQDGVDVSLSLNGSALGAVTPDRANDTFSATIPATSLREDNNNVTATFSGPGAPAQPQTMNVQLDTVAPADATATPGPGTYRTPQSVSLETPEEGARILYTTGDGEPDREYDGPIPVNSSQTIKAIVVDTAGNPSGVVPFAYDIDAEGPVLSANLDTAHYTGTQSLELTSEEGAEIFYTIDGSAPNRGAREYTGPIEIAETETVRAVAFDAAGNRSGEVLERTITIRKETTTSLKVSTKDLRVGRSRAISGTVSPASRDNAGKMVEVTIDRPGALGDVVKNVQLDAASGYALAYTPRTTGKYSVSVSFTDTDDLYLDSTSETRSFRVVRR